MSGVIKKVSYQPRCCCSFSESNQDGNWCKKFCTHLAEHHLASVAFVFSIVLASSLLALQWGTNVGTIIPAYSYAIAYSSFVALTCTRGYFYFKLKAPETRNEAEEDDYIEGDPPTPLLPGENEIFSPRREIPEQSRTVGRQSSHTFEVKADVHEPPPHLSSLASTGTVDHLSSFPSFDSDVPELSTSFEASEFTSSDQIANSGKSVEATKHDKSGHPNSDLSPDGVLLKSTIISTSEPAPKTNENAVSISAPGKRTETSELDKSGPMMSSPSLDDASRLTTKSSTKSSIEINRSDGPSDLILESGKSSAPPHLDESAQSSNIDIPPPSTTRKHTESTTERNERATDGIAEKEKSYGTLV